jgi:hypothetical protein
LRTFGAILLVVAAIVLPSASSAQKAPRIYRWVDDNGVMQYGDKIPPEYANRDRDLLNDDGVQVGFEEGEITDAEQAVNAQREAEAEADRKTRAAIARRDRMLLETYLSIGDIEDLRNRRLELLESQIKLTEVYLGNLRKKLLDVQAEAGNYKPYTTKPDAPQIPENLKLEISRTTALIALYEQTLARTRADQHALKVSFDEDIARFRELKNH